MVTAPAPAAGDVSFPGMDSREEFRFYYRRHWVVFAPAIGSYALWMLAFVGLVFMSSAMETEDDFTRRAILVGLSFFLLIPNIIFIRKLYAHFLYVVIVTDKKIHKFKSTLIAMDRHENIDLSQLQEISKLQRSIIQNIFGFGTLKLEAQNSHLTVHFTPHIDDIYKKIITLREAARERAMPVQVPAEEKELPVQPS